MKNILLFVPFLFTVFSCNSQVNDDLEKIKKELKAVEGKYTYDVDILENEVIKNRLVKLVGPQVFDDVTECFMTVTPYKISNDIFYFSGSSKLSYNSCNIAFDMKRNVFHVKIVYDESGEEKVFSDEMELYNKLPDEIIN